MFLPTGFHFRIIFNGIDDPGQLDSSFLSVDGLEAFARGAIGEPPVSPDTFLNRPGHSVLTLRRAARQYNQSALIRWMFSHFSESNQEPIKIASIEILDEEHQPFMVFTIRNITPKSWKLGELNATKSEILLETIELYYEELQQEKI